LLSVIFWRSNACKLLFSLMYVIYHWIMLCNWLSACETDFEIFWIVFLVKLKCKIVHFKVPCPLNFSAYSIYLGVLCLVYVMILRKLTRTCSIISRFSYPHISIPYVRMGITVKSNNYNSKSIGKSSKSRLFALNNSWCFAF
jgi:hypothetical protein